MAGGLFSFTSTSSGKTEKSLREMLKRDRVVSILNGYGAQGVAALAAATPRDKGNTAGSWYYEVTQGAGGYSLVFRNSNINDGEVIAILLHYGHGTRNGGYVEGRDYINNAIQPIFDRIAADAWRVVTSA